MRSWPPHRPSLCARRAPFRMGGSARQMYELSAGGEVRPVLTAGDLRPDPRPDEQAHANHHPGRLGGPLPDDSRSLSRVDAARLPGGRARAPLRPLPPEFGRHCSRTGFVSRRTTDDLPPFRLLRQAVRDVALGRGGQAAREAGAGGYFSFGSAAPRWSSTGSQLIDVAMPTSPTVVRADAAAPPPPASPPPLPLACRGECPGPNVPCGDAGAFWTHRMPLRSM